MRGLRRRPRWATRAQAHQAHAAAAMDSRRSAAASARPRSPIASARRAGSAGIGRTAEHADGLPGCRASGPSAILQSAPVRRGLVADPRLWRRGESPISWEPGPGVSTKYVICGKRQIAAESCPASRYNGRCRFAALALAGCGGQRSAGVRLREGAESGAQDYLSPPRVDAVLAGPAGVTLAGTATAGGKVRLATPAGQAVHATVDAKSRWAIALPPAAEARSSACRRAPVAARPRRRAITWSRPAVRPPCCAPAQPARCASIPRHASAFGPSISTAGAAWRLLRRPRPAPR